MNPRAFSTNRYDWPLPQASHSYSTSLVTGRSSLTRWSAFRLCMGAVLTGALAVSLSGCQYSPMRVVHGDPSVRSVIKTDPPGAKITVDGREIGRSPVTFLDKSGGRKTYVITVEKEGYHAVTRTLKRNWDSMQLMYRLDPIYYYSLTALPGTKETMVASPRRQEEQRPVRRIQPVGREAWASIVDKIPPARQPDSDRDAVAIVIGISKYREDVIPRVRYAKRDADTVAAYLEAVGGIPRSKMKVLRDEQATLSDLTAYIEEWLPRRVSSDTTVFVYYAGHGTPDPVTGKAFLVPYDGHPDFSSKLYPLDRLYEKLDELPAKEVVVMLDSCFSGAQGRSVLPSGARPLVTTVENPVLASQKLAVLAAATGTQISSDYDEEQHGLFTYFLLKGLRGDADQDKSGSVDVAELFKYVSKSVKKVAAEELNRDQTPVLHPSLENIGSRGKVPITIGGG